MKIEKALEIAREAGFEIAVPMDPQKLEFRTEVRDMCAACKAYGKKWVCPPACGEIADMPARFHKYQDGVLFQVICRMNDELDFEAMGDVMQQQKKSIKNLLEAINASDEDIYVFGNDGCGNCTECTYPDEPCKFPDIAHPSLESCGLLVSDVCKDNDLPYYYGRNTVAFTGAFLFNPKTGKEE
ncbi:MAG: DUF2284 domain-containing protein [Eubacteriaceae bacterium]|nr:DUF2284 domain-containing protein [Eubacteriaceae bacterium]